MEIREATEADIPEIVALLKVSLGESLMPKSERYWRWKHLENPFGPSPVLLCWDKSQLVGVRAFMCWEWIQQGQVYYAIRAVDTATHPDYQGKGIFKKLTLALLERCKERGVNFIYNTPNRQSKPGYLKMGWEEAGKLPILVSVQRPFSILRHFLFSAKSPGSVVHNSQLKYYLHNDNLKTLLTSHRDLSEQLITNISAQYLRWRYIDVPVANYVAVGEHQGEALAGLIIGRVKENRLGLELRITDFFLRPDCDGKELIAQLKDLRKEWRIDYTTMSGTMRTNTRRRLSRLEVKSTLGPVVTIRPVAMSDLNLLRNFKQWSPSLGDLELF